MKEYLFQQLISYYSFHSPNSFSIFSRLVWSEYMEYITSSSHWLEHMEYITSSSHWLEYMEYITSSSHWLDVPTLKYWKEK